MCAHCLVNHTDQILLEFNDEKVGLVGAQEGVRIGQATSAVVVLQLLCCKSGCALHPRQRLQQLLCLLESRCSSSCGGAALQDAIPRVPAWSSGSSEAG